MSNKQSLSAKLLLEPGWLSLLVLVLWVLFGGALGIKTGMHMYAYYGISLFEAVLLGGIVFTVCAPLLWLVFRSEVGSKN